MVQKSRNFTVLFIPEDERRTFSLKIRVVFLRTLVSLLLLFSLGAIVLMLRAGSIALQLQLLPQLRAENKHLKAENERLEDIRMRLARVQEMDAYLQNLALLENGGVSRQTRYPLEHWIATSVDTEDMPGSITSPSSVAGTLDDSTQRLYAQQIRQATPYIMPVRGWMTRSFSEQAEDGREKHLGVDFAASEGTPIFATAPGTIENIQFDEYLGKLLTIRHLSGFITRYGHCAQILVISGQHVQRGQVVATVGNTGTSSAPHLHYEVLKDGRHVDPMRYILN